MPEVRVGVKVNSAGAIKDLEALDKRVRAITKRDSTVTVKFKAGSSLGRVKKQVDGIAKKHLTVKFKAGASLKNVKRQVGKIGDVTVKFKAGKSLADIERRVKSLNQTIRIKVVADTTGIANLGRTLRNVQAQGPVRIPTQALATQQVIAGGGRATAPAGGRVGRSVRGIRAGQGLSHLAYMLPGPAGQLGAAAGYMGGGAMAGAVAAGIPIGLGVISGSHEEKLDRVQAAALATESQMVKVRKETLNIAADTLFSSKEAAMAMEVLARNGLSIADIYGGAAKAATEISVATALGDQGPADNLLAASDIVTDAMVQFGLGADEMSKAGDLITAFTLTSKGTLTDFYYLLSNAGPTFSSFAKGMNAFEDFVIASAAAMPYFHTGRRAGTAGKTFLQRLAAPTDAVRTMIGDDPLLAPLRREDGGLNWFDMEGNLKSMGEVADLLKTTFATMTPEKRGFYLKEIFGSEAVKFATAIMDRGSEGLAQQAAKMEPITSESVTEIKMGNLPAEWKIFTSRLETAAIMLGEGPSEALTAMFQSLNELLADKILPFLEERKAQAESKDRDAFRAKLAMSGALNYTDEPSYYGMEGGTRIPSRFEVGVETPSVLDNLLTGQRPPSTPTPEERFAMLTPNQQRALTLQAMSERGKAHSPGRSPGLQWLYEKFDEALYDIGKGTGLLNVMPTGYGVGNNRMFSAGPTITQGGQGIINRLATGFAGEPTSPIAGSRTGSGVFAAAWEWLRDRFTQDPNFDLQSHLQTVGQNRASFGLGAGGTTALGAEDPFNYIFSGGYPSPGLGATTNAYTTNNNTTTIIINANDRSGSTPNRVDASNLGIDEIVRRVTDALQRNNGGNDTSYRTPSQLYNYGHFGGGLYNPYGIQ